MPLGAVWRFNGPADGGNLTDDNVNSLEMGGNVHLQVPNALAVEVTPVTFTSSSVIREEYGGGTAVMPASTSGTKLWLTPAGGTPVLNTGAAWPGGEHYPLAEVDTDGVGVVAITDRRPKGTSVVGGGPPSGPAGGSLAGTYPNPTIAAGAINDAEVNAAAAIAESKLALNFPTHDNANDPTADEKAALAGTGVPSAGDPYVNDSDARMTDARTPTAHAASHQHGGGDEVATDTPAANAIPKALGTGKIADGWINRQVRGDDRQHPTADPRTTTTNGPGLPALKLQLVTGALTGTYLILWQAEVDNDNLVNNGTVRLQNTTDAVTLDSHGYGARALPSTQPRRVFGMAELVLAGVSKTVEIQWYDNAGGNTQGIAKARMEFFRVA